MKVVHSWLKEYLGDALPEPNKVEELLTFHAFEVDGVEELDGETVIDVDVLPNRSSDSLCHRGVARELASILAVPLAYDPLQEDIALVSTNDIEVHIVDTEACPRFTASLITGVTVGESPEWLQTRLKAMGMRSINNIVDATNYVMFAIGEPIHAYDADLFPKVDGKWKFEVRFAAAGEKVSLLSEGGKEKVSADTKAGALGEEGRIIECVGTELLIVDGSSNTPIGLAGVKGGRFAGVHAGTKNIIIEAAHFNPTVTRKTARRLGIVIDASKRFENEPSRELPPYAQNEIIKLITDIAGGTFVGWVDEYTKRQVSVAVEVPVAQVNSLLGVTLSATEIKAYLENIGAQIVAESTEKLTAVSPWERTDLLIAEDYIEEVGRLHGLDKIASVLPELGVALEVSKTQYYAEKIRQALLELGFSEVITSSFQKKGDLQLRNSLASDKSYMRSNLTKNITATLDKNFTHGDLLGLSDIRVFEIGTVFEKNARTVTEHLSLAVGVRVKGNGYTSKDDTILDVASEAVMKALGTEVVWENTAGVREMNVTAVLERLPVPRAYEPFVPSAPVTYQPVSQYPASARDIALWVAAGDEADGVIRKLVAAAGPLLVRQTLFDTFTKDDRTSYAFRLVFQATDRTLTDAEINTYMEAVNTAAKESGWEVR